MARTPNKQGARMPPPTPPTPVQPVMVTPPPQPANGYYRVKEVAALLKISERQVFNLMASGQIRSLKFGRITRISAAALAEFTTAHEGVPA